MSLLDVLRRNDFSGFPLMTAKHIVRQILEAVAFLHSVGVVHTDIKPDNILLAPHDIESKLRESIRRDEKGTHMLDDSIDDAARETLRLLGRPGKQKDPRGFKLRQRDGTCRNVDITPAKAISHSIDFMKGRKIHEDGSIPPATPLPRQVSEETTVSPSRAGFPFSLPSELARLSVGHPTLIADEPKLSQEEAYEVVPAPLNPTAMHVAADGLHADQAELGGPLLSPSTYASRRFSRELSQGLNKLQSQFRQEEEEEYLSMKPRKRSSTRGSSYSRSSNKTSPRQATPAALPSPTTKTLETDNLCRPMQVGPPSIASNSSARSHPPSSYTTSSPETALTSPQLSLHSSPGKPQESYADSSSTYMSFPASLTSTASPASERAASHMQIMDQGAAQATSLLCNPQHRTLAQESDLTPPAEHRKPTFATARTATAQQLASELEEVHIKLADLGNALFLDEIKRQGALPEFICTRQIARRRTSSAQSSTSLQISGRLVA